MESSRRLLLCVCLFVALAVPSSGLECPVFKCGLGQVVKGKFTDPTDPLKEPPSPLFEAYFTPGQMYNYNQYNISDERLVNPQEECYKFCLGNNVKLGTTVEASKKAKYWMYEDTCEDTTGGICTCHGKAQCENGPNSYSDKWMQGPTGSGDDYQVPSNFSVGMLCDAEEKGDPHFRGADGSHFDFSGVPNSHYALISDAHLQVNAFFGGRYTAWNGTRKAVTWIRSLGILFGHHTAILDARTGPSADYGSGYLQRVTVDGAPLKVPAPGTGVALWEGAELRWTNARMRSGSDLVDVYTLQIGDVATLRLTMRPEVKQLRTALDGAVHFGLDVARSAFSPAVHGVLGQTFRPDFVGRLAQQKLVYSDLLGVEMVPGDNAEGFIDGGVPDYTVSGILRTDCRFCRFTRAENVDSETSSAIAMLSGGAFNIAESNKAAARKYLMNDRR